MNKVGGIRLQIALLTVVACFFAMIGVVALSAYASWTAMEDIINQTLVERLDRAEEAVREGEIQQAIDHSGIELLQVVDADGHVIASTPNAQGLAPIWTDKDGDDVLELDDFEIEEYIEDLRENTPALVGASPADGVADDDDDDDDVEGYDDDDWDDDDVSPGNRGEGGQQTPAVSWDDGDTDDADDHDYDADDHDSDDADDDADDGDDDKHRATRADDVFRFFGPQLAYAAETPTASSSQAADSAASASDASLDDVPSVVASSVMGTPGPFLVMKRTVDAPDGAVTLVAMTSLAPAMETAQRVALWVSVLLLVLLVLAGAFAWHMTGRTLRPVDRMRREVEAISARNLSERITPPENDRDLSALADTFNGLLGRVEASVEEQKRFISDASHELKSPIASTSLMLETLREHPDSVPTEVVLADLTAENDRLAHIVDDLLVLARQDEGRQVVDLAPTDFYDVLMEEASSLRRRFPVEVDVSGVNPVIGESDASLLSHSVRNLLDNAARYAHTKVVVSCREVDGWVDIRISDDGPGIPEIDRERVFSRFVRLEEGRSRKKGSTGLGLSVARGNIERLGGTLVFGEPEYGGATAIIRLPLAQH